MTIHKLLTAFAAWVTAAAGRVRNIENRRSLAMTVEIKSVVEKYISLRDQKAEIAERHKVELAPLNESMEIIEKWLLQEMEKMGVESLKTPAGTPYKTITKSVKMADPDAFKRFVFTPLIDSLTGMLQAQGVHVPDLYSLLQGGVFWDMIDFRAGKKGIVEYAEQNGSIPPGVTVDNFTTINIRRA
jgi:hypothetical protein